MVIPFRKGFYMEKDHEKIRFLVARAGRTRAPTCGLEAMNPWFPNLLKRLDLFWF